MQETKHIDALKEVRETTRAALQDPRGLIPHQRRLMALISLGMAHLAELYLHFNRALKPGAQLKHNWFKSDERKLLIRLAGALTKSPEHLPDFSRVLAIARKIELDRDDIVYGAPLADDAILREKVDLLLELKKTVDRSGSIPWE